MCKSSHPAAAIPCLIGASITSAFHAATSHRRLMTLLRSANTSLPSLPELTTSYRGQSCFRRAPAQAGSPGSRGGSQRRPKPQAAAGTPGHRPGLPAGLQRPLEGLAQLYSSRECAPSFIRSVSQTIPIGKWDGIKNG